MRKQSCQFVALVLAAVLILAACGGGNDDAAETSAEDAGGDSGPTPSGGGTLIFARGADSSSLDPGSTADGEASRVTVQVFETLTRFAEDSFEIEPGLAESWDVSEDGLSYTFHLRKGVEFHDGTPFDADAVIFNFERWSDPEHPYHFAEEGFIYSSYVNQFGGLKDDESHVIEEINKIDEHTVEFVLKRPVPAFLQNMAMSYFGLASPKSLETYGTDIVEHPVGTGPFVFEEWVRDDAITLVKNENYWQDGYPLVDRVIFQVIPDNAARLTALQSGEVDIADGLNPDDLERVEGDPNVELLQRDANNIGYLGFNMEKEPFNDPLVRKAMNYAVNKENLIATVYNDLAEPAKNPLPPSYLGYNDDIAPYEYDPEKARDLLAEAGYADGFTFDLWTMPVPRPYMPDPNRAAEALQTDFAEIGLTANIVTMEWATYLDELTQGNQEVYMIGWSGVNGDPDYFLNNLLAEHSIPDPNYSRYRNRDLTELLLDAQSVLDEKERAAMYARAQEIVHEDAAMIPLVHTRPALGVSKRVQDYVPHLSVTEPLTKVHITD
ncbi:MAG: ABC transporter substrate-binding protein [Novibacillus thermophilus]|uniref:ABC transporter substrate-binding protein n=1 Tax=Novibacillus thermophilus TaxID=1471761 RepID=A0A1U9K7C8_9BACL|nr:ABC transporter substrate-binding protein [Novibacillus thermophilus]AQS55930.1 ABC transporter substrate-binding protein [Novibacillus thermophilus]